MYLFFKIIAYYFWKSSTKMTDEILTGVLTKSWDSTNSGDSGDPKDNVLILKSNPEM